MFWRQKFSEGQCKHTILVQVAAFPLSLERRFRLGCKHEPELAKVLAFDTHRSLVFEVACHIDARESRRSHVRDHERVCHPLPHLGAVGIASAEAAGLDCTVKRGERVMAQNSSIVTISETSRLLCHNARRKRGKRLHLGVPQIGQSIPKPLRRHGPRSD